MSYQPEQQKLLHQTTSPVTLDSGKLGGQDNGGAHTSATLAAEYRFVHQRIPERTGSERFFLPTFLLTFQIIFIILFAFFGNYQSDDKIKESNELVRKYPSN